MNPETRRGRFIVPTAALSALIFQYPDYVVKLLYRPSVHYPLSRLCCETASLRPLES
jgi:hypothetical protein